jgi:predicted RNA binding protein YcfA (HicA-like mRNA interferase family)
MRAREVNRIIEAKGGQHVRTVGSHKRYRVTVAGVTASTAVPQHPGDIPTGTLRKIESDLAPALGRKWLL